jgi:hypothetical protein
MSFRRLAGIAGRLFSTTGLIAVSIAGAAVAAQEQHTGTLIPGATGSSMVEETGRLRRSDRPLNRGAAAKRRAANEAHDSLRRFASCLVGGAEASSERRNMAAFLSTDPDDPAINKRTDKILRENCVYGTGAESALLRFQPGLLRGAIFRQLYLDQGTQAAARITRADVAGVWSFDAGGSYAANQRFADCIVAANPKAADSFVRAKVASVQQDAALGELMGRMGGCLTQGLTLQMSRVVLDGLMAEALYRKATAPGAMGAPQSNLIAQGR